MERDNPKLIQALKDGKAPLEYLVLSVLEGDAYVHKSGADKYGICNWLKDKIKASTYVGAILRHLTAWALGQDIDPESGYSHLYHIRACCAILLDSSAHGTLIDDRNRCESIDNEQDARISKPHTPTMREKIDMDKPDALGGPFEVRFTVFAEDGSQERAQTRGPYQTLAHAYSYANRNPEGLPGVASIHTFK